MTSPPPSASRSCASSGRAAWASSTRRTTACAAAPSLKTLRSGDAAALLRFKEEFRAPADIAHENLVTLHELFADKGAGSSRWSSFDHFVEQVRAISARTLVLRGRCYEKEAVPFKALDAVVDRLARTLRRMPDAEVRGLAFLALALADARRIRRLRPDFAEGRASLIEAAAAWLRGDVDDAVARLDRAGAASEAAEQPIVAALARRRLGAVIGGERGKALIVEAERALERSGVPDAATVARVFSPGFRDA